MRYAGLAALGYLLYCGWYVVRGVRRRVKLNKRFVRCLPAINRRVFQESQAKESAT